MGLFDRMFGRGATQAQQQPDAQQRFDQLKQKYQTVLTVIEQQNVRLQNLHVQDDKLFIRGVAPSEDAKNKVWDQIKLIDNTYSDLTADITVNSSLPQPAGTVATGAGAAAGGGMQTYIVQPGDTLSKISKEFYGDANQYMKIFEANKDQLNNPDQIKAGQHLKIPTHQTT